MIIFWPVLGNSPVKNQLQNVLPKNDELLLVSVCMFKLNYICTLQHYASNRKGYVRTGLTYSSTWVHYVILHIDFTFSMAFVCGLDNCKLRLTLCNFVCVKVNLLTYNFSLRNSNLWFFFSYIVSAITTKLWFIHMQPFGPFLWYCLN